MGSDMIERLRLMSMSKRTLYGEDDPDAPFYDEAADCIARLRTALATAEAERDRAMQACEQIGERLTTAEAERDAAVERAERAWQPIETAPKDGSDILIWPGPYGKVVVAGWACTFWSVQHLSIKACRTLAPTRWRPLPEPPAIRALRAEAPAAPSRPGSDA